jgi:hypothetical protein
MATNSVTIAVNTALSNALRIPHGMFIEMIEFPAGWTTADVTFSLSKDGGATFFDGYDDVGEITYKAGASRITILDTHRHCLTGVVKLRSGTSGTPVNQTGADKLLVVYLKQTG